MQGVLLTINPDPNTAPEKNALAKAVFDDPRMKEDMQLLRFYAQCVMTKLVICFEDGNN